jgi:putative endonuclease
LPEYGTIDGFTKRYDCDRLVYFEQYPDMTSAITREKNSKTGRAPENTR